jgi:hypothetical protein
MAESKPTKIVDGIIKEFTTEETIPTTNVPVLSTDKIADNSITTSKIQDSAITDRKIDSSVARAQNILINGGFEIWQRGTSFSDGAYNADRWRIASIEGGPWNISRESDIKMINSNYSMKITINGYMRLEQRLENIEELRNKTLSLSIWAKSDTDNTSIQIGIFDGVIDTSPIYTIGTDWEKLTVTHTVHPAASTNYTPAVRIIVNSSVVYLDNAMLVIGSQPVDYVPRPIGEELLLCQRYYEKSYPLDVPPGSYNTDGYKSQASTKLWSGSNYFAYMGVVFKVPKRTVPSVTIYNPYAANDPGKWHWEDPGVASENVPTTIDTGVTKDGFAIYTTQATGYRYTGWGHWIADAEM